MRGRRLGRLGRQKRYPQTWLALAVSAQPCHALARRTGPRDQLVGSQAATGDRRLLRYFRTWESDRSVGITRVAAADRDATAAVRDGDRDVECRRLPGCGCKYDLLAVPPRVTSVAAVRHLVTAIRTRCGRSNARARAVTASARERLAPDPVYTIGDATRTLHTGEFTRPRCRCNGV